MGTQIKFVETSPGVWQIKFCGNQVSFDETECCISCCVDTPTWQVTWTGDGDAGSQGSTFQLNASSECSWAAQQFVCNYFDATFGSTDVYVIFLLSWRVDGSTGPNGWTASAEIRYDSSGISDPASKVYSWPSFSTDDDLTCIGTIFTLSVADASVDGSGRGCLQELTGSVTFEGI